MHAYPFGVNEKHRLLTVALLHQIRSLKNRDRELQGNLLTLFHPCTLFRPHGWQRGTSSLAATISCQAKLFKADNQ